MKTIQISFFPNKIKIKSDCISEHELAQILTTATIEFESYAIENKASDKFDIEYSILLNKNILKKYIFNTPLKRHSISPRVKVSLINKEIETVLQLIRLRREKVNLVRGIGEKAILELDDFLNKLGLKFDMSDEEIFIHCEKALEKQKL